MAGGWLFSMCCRCLLDVPTRERLSAARQVDGFVRKARNILVDKQVRGL
jgi:hypothetical protein